MKKAKFKNYYKRETIPRSSQEGEQREGKIVKGTGGGRRKFVIPRSGATLFGDGGGCNDSTK